MKLWILYIAVSFLIGAVMWRSPASARARIVAGLCLLLCIGYYVMHQI
jgi:hypothetical protein